MSDSSLFRAFREGVTAIYAHGDSESRSSAPPTKLNPDCVSLTCTVLPLREACSNRRFRLPN
jgi:hypothetical protein